MTESEPQSSPSPRKRRRLQYSLRALLVFMLLASIGMSYLAVTIREARRQKQVLEALKKMATTKYVACEPIWLSKVSGDDSLVNVIGINVDSSSHFTHDCLIQVAGLNQLRILTLRGPKITDADLLHLQGLSRLQNLWLIDAPIGDAGLVHLGRMRQLQLLQISSPNVTDAGLVHLRSLSRLRLLRLNGTKVTAEGVKRLQEALPKCRIQK